MRLTLFEIENIIKLKNKYFGENSKIYLFGSRIDDAKKGGDIDLFIEYEKDDKYDKKNEFLIDLESVLGEQKIDVVLSKDKNRLIEIESRKGMELNLEKIKLTKYFNECDKHLLRIEDAFADTSDVIPLTVKGYENLSKDKIQAIDQYLFRFAKLQDSIGDRIFKLIFNQYNQNNEIVPFIDMLNQLEKLGFLHSSKEWINLRNIRNNIAHQYDDVPEEMSKAINDIFTQKDIIKDIYLSLKEKSKGLL
jgi:predicted nucleotidyltransferase